MGRPGGELAIEQHGPHHRNFGCHQLGGEVVLFLNLRIAPALRPVELGDHRGAVFQLHLVDAVFVGRESGQAPVATQAHAVQRVKHQVGSEGFKGVEGGARGAVHGAIVVLLPIRGAAKWLAV